jgi:hypothetical protein
MEEAEQNTNLEIKQATEIVKIIRKIKNGKKTNNLNA